MADSRYYRNKQDMQIDADHVDAGSLWKLNHANTLVLVDDDRFVSHTLDANFE